MSNAKQSNEVKLTTDDKPLALRKTPRSAAGGNMHKATTSQQSSPSGNNGKDSQSLYTKRPIGFLSRNSDMGIRKLAATIGGVKRKRSTSSFPGVLPVCKRKRQFKETKNQNDNYCWSCHKEGVLVCCEVCPRSFHLRCGSLNKPVEKEWVCPECDLMLKAENVDTRSTAMKALSIDQLCNLLKFAISRMKLQCPDEFLKPVPLDLFPNYGTYIVHPMDLETLEKNIKKKMYGCTESFLADAKWILHNCIIFNGYNHKLTSIAKSLMKICKHEMNEIEVCPDCYHNAYTKRDNWFQEPCCPPHLLIWARLKGFPFWPAKAMRIVSGNVDVRFFGAHDRAWIPVSQCFLLSNDIPSTMKIKKRGVFEQSMEELSQHIIKLKERFKFFEYAPFRTALNAQDLNVNLQNMLPGVNLKDFSRSSVGRHNQTFRYCGLNNQSPVKGFNSLSEDTPTSIKQEFMQPLSSPENEQRSHLADTPQIVDVQIKKGLRGYKLRQQRLGKNKLENAIEKIKSIGKEFEASRINQEKDASNLETSPEKDALEAEIDDEPNVNEYDGDDSESHEIMEPHLKEVNNSNSEFSEEVDDTIPPFSFSKHSCAEENRVENESCHTDSSEHESEVIENIDERPSSRQSDDKYVENDEPVTDTNDVGDIQIELQENEEEEEDKERAMTPVSPTLKTELSGDTHDSSSACQNQEPSTSSHNSSAASDSKTDEQDHQTEELIETPEKETSKNDDAPDTSNSEGEKNTALVVDDKGSNAENNEALNDSSSQIPLAILSVTSLQDTPRSFDVGEDKNAVILPEAVESSDETVGGSSFQSPREGTSTEETDFVIDLDKDKEEDSSNANIAKTSQTRRPFGGIKLMEKKASKEKGSSTTNSKGKKSSLEIHIPADLSATEMSNNGGFPSTLPRLSPLGMRNQGVIVNNQQVVQRAMPALQPRPSPLIGPIPQTQLASGNSSLNKYSQKMVDFVRGTMEEMFKDLANTGNPEATIKTLQLELEKMQWCHQQAITEMKHNTDLILLEMRNSMESEKQRIISEVRRQCEIEKQRAIEEVKKKQWCAYCGKEALFYCCWNTSYCDYPCQQAHWPQHVSVCSQTQTGNEVSGRRFMKEVFPTDNVRSNARKQGGKHQKKSKDFFDHHILTEQVHIQGGDQLNPNLAAFHGLASLPVQYINSPPQTTAIPTSTLQAQPIPTRFPAVSCPSGYALSRGTLPDSPTSLFQQRPPQVNYF